MQLILFVQIQMGQQTEATSIYQRVHKTTMRGKARVVGYSIFQNEKT
jgi:hypothetical protein